MPIKRWNPKNALVSMARIFAIYAILCCILFFVQRSLLFHPTHHSQQRGLAPWREDGQIIGQCRELEQPNAIWLMMHGNAGQASDRDYILDHISSDTSIYVLEYPGYGERTGRPSQQAFNSAAIDAYGRLRKKYPNLKIGVIGESIGSGPASMLTQLPNPPDKLILVVPFDTLYNVAARRMFFLPVWLLLLDRWDNIQAMGKYTGPIEIYGAKQDDVIPCLHAKNLADHYPNARFVELECGHNDWPLLSDIQFQH